MNGIQKLVLHGANLSVVATGLVYGWMRYLAEPADEWAIVNHPWQPLLQHLHVLAAPILIFAVGLIWGAHVVGKLRNGGGNRVAGVGLAIVFAPMAATGYLLQVSVDPEWRQYWTWLHVSSSLVWVAVFVVHHARARTAAEHRQSGMLDSASAMAVSHRCEGRSGSISVSGDDRKRSTRCSSGTRAARIADSTSAEVGGVE
jgi:hypothetical protein